MLADANELVGTIKKVAIEAVEATKPVNVCFGEVISTSPLLIDIEQKMKLSEKQLILSRNVTDYAVTAAIDVMTDNYTGAHSHAVYSVDGEGNNTNLITDSKDIPHTHKIQGEQTITVRNGLAVGDSVILMRQQSGQKFIVLDRIGK